MTKLLNVDIPFCNHDAYRALSMHNRCVLLAMYHLWLAHGKRNVPFDAQFKKLMCEVLSVPDFNYFDLGRNTRAKYAKLNLVTTSEVFVFVQNTPDYPGDSKSCTNARPRVQNARLRAQNARSRVQNARSQIQKCATKPEVLMVETPLHDSFING